MGASASRDPGQRRASSCGPSRNRSRSSRVDADAAVVVAARRWSFAGASVRVCPVEKEDKAEEDAVHVDDSPSSSCTSCSRMGSSSGSSHSSSSAAAVAASSSDDVVGCDGAADDGGGYAHETQSEAAWRPCAVRILHMDAYFAESAVFAAYTRSKPRKRLHSFLRAILSTRGGAPFSSCGGGVPPSLHFEPSSSSAEEAQTKGAASRSAPRLLLRRATQHLLLLATASGSSSGAAVAKAEADLLALMQLRQRQLFGDVG